ncbi:MAG: hypothetical protein C5B48_02445 [Candidatus Rokuibacteriota bacterium]|nr:MAG: hypothetical protein C5B48_02445 [Candidatus Rokubacteria bacterium]
MARSPDPHEHAAAYALDALENGERRHFEAHLHSCTLCAEELPSLQAAAAALALAIEGSAVPRAVRIGLMQNVSTSNPSPPAVPRWRRAALPASCALAAGAAVAGLALGLRPAPSPDPTRAFVLPLRERPGSLIVTQDRSAFLVLASLRPAPTGRMYEAWVVEHGVARPAGIFTGEGTRLIVLLKRKVPGGAHVAVSLEPRGGSPRLTGPLILTTGSA